MTFEVCPMTFPEDMSKMEDYIYKIFLPDVPMTHIFNIDTNPDLRYRHPIPYKPSTTGHNIYLKAVDSNGEMIGIAINKDPTVFETDSNTPEEWKQLQECLAMSIDIPHIKNLPGKLMDLFILSVHPDWRNQDVARRLAEESIALTRAAGYTTMKTTCVNEYTAKLMRSLGWKELNRMAYMDYPKLSGVNVTLKPSPQNEYVYIYGLDL